MAQESKEIDPKLDETIIHDEMNSTEVASTSENDHDDAEEEGIDAANKDGGATESSATKKKSKRARLKKALGAGSSSDVGPSEGSSASANTASKLTTSMVEQLLEMNPSLKSEVAGMGKEEAAEAVKRLDVADLLTGMVIKLAPVWYCSSF